VQSRDETHRHLHRARRGPQCFSEWPGVHRDVADPYASDRGQIPARAKSRCWRSSPTQYGTAWAQKSGRCAQRSCNPTRPGIALVAASKTRVPRPARPPDAGQRSSLVFREAGAGRKATWFGLPRGCSGPV